MSLDALFAPQSIAVVGASDDPRRIGGRPLRYLAEAGYGGKVYPVNPKRETVQGWPAYPHINAIGTEIDMAIIALPARAALDAVRDCGNAGVKFAVVFSAGFAEVGPEGAQLQLELRQVTEETGIRILGPNCLGLINVSAGVIGTFSSSLDTSLVLPGRIGFVSQSGAFGSHCLSLARQQGIGLGKWITTGNEADLDFADCLAYLATDPETDLIVGYLEGTRNGPALHAALALAQENRKPVVVLKVGRSEVGAHAVASHTATLVGSDAAYDAVFRRYGVHRASTITELLDVAVAASRKVFPRGNRIGLVSASGGVGILMADAATESGLDVAPMPELAQKRLKELVPFAGVANPVDVTAQTVNDPSLLADFLETMLEFGDYDLVVTYLGPGGLSEKLAPRVHEPLRAIGARHPDVPILLSMIATPEIHARFSADGLVPIADPSDAVNAAVGLTVLGKTVHAAPSAVARPRRPVPPLPPGLLGEHELKKLLNSAGIPAPREYLVKDQDAAVTAARSLDGRVAMKVASPLIQHKTEISGVLLGIEGDEGVRAAYRQLVARAGDHTPAAGEDGVLITPMVEGVVELILGVHRDAALGPLVMLGLGGVLAEALNDVALRVPPFDIDEAHAMLRELRGFPLLNGWRGAPAADLDAVAAALVALSHVAVAWQEDVESLEVNPLVAMPAGQGVAALDALLIRRPTAPEED